MDDDILGYDCDGCEIYEYRILRAMFSNDINIKDLEGVDPREYCAIRGEDGIAYAISVHPYTNRSLIKSNSPANNLWINVVKKLNNLTSNLLSVGQVLKI